MYCVLIGFQWTVAYVQSTVASDAADQIEATRVICSCYSMHLWETKISSGGCAKTFCECALREALRGVEARVPVQVYALGP